MIAPAIGPNRCLTVFGRRSMPADSLARYSAGVSDCGCLTSQHVASGLRLTRVRSRLISSPLRERRERPRPWLFVGLGVRWLFLLGLQAFLNSGFFAYWRVSRLSRRPSGF
nr:MAG TPA: hypothetical protein [Caudoviricetes sp.]